MHTKAPRTLTLALLAGMMGIGSVLSAGEAQVFSGKSITVDDALFVGCMHNAFEGQVEKAADGVISKGKQGILRTKGVLHGAGAVFSKATLSFTLEQPPASPVTLVLNGLDDDTGPANVIAVSLNNKEFQAGPLFSKNDLSATKNFRYYVGWKDVPLAIPPGLLRAGENLLTIENRTSCLTANTLNYSLFDYVRFEFQAETKLSIHAPPTPIYYYGLSQGPEVNLWPAVNLGNRICLVPGVDIQYTFYVTLPKDVPLGASQKPVEAKTEVLLHFETDADLVVTDLAGKPLAPSQAQGRSRFTRALPRLMNYATPHPSQGVSVQLKAAAPCEGRTLTAWCSIEGKEYPARTYALRAAAVEPLERRVPGFLLSLWGGGVPSDPKNQEAQVRFLSSIGINHMFTGNAEALNRTLKEKGFAVYPRFGWFSNALKVTPANEAWVAIDAEGNKSKEYCPLGILERADDVEMGKSFRIAREYAGLANIDGLCVDFECGAVWCWCERCLKLFQTETGIAPAGRAELAAGGKYEQEYKDFGRRRNRDLLSRVRDIMKAVNPKLEYAALASACDMPSYWWDGRDQGRHSLHELAKFADTILVSAYCYKLPGGLKSVRPLIQTTRQFALDSGRKVNVGLITPLATTISETPRFQDLTLDPQRLRLFLLLAATGGGKALSLFRGDCLDGEHYLSVRRAMAELAPLEPYYREGSDRSFEIDAQPAGEVARRIHLPITESFLSRVPWRPDVSYDYEVVQFVRNYLARERVLLAFNFSAEEMPLRIKIRGLNDPAYVATDFATAKELGLHSRLDLETGKLTVRVPPLDCVMLKLEAKPERAAAGAKATAAESPIAEP